jgi:uncharacterized protein YfiM (DUF2279 family)
VTKDGSELEPLQTKPDDSAMVRRLVGFCVGEALDVHADLSSRRSAVFRRRSKIEINRRQMSDATAAVSSLLSKALFKAVKKPSLPVYQVVFSLRLRAALDDRRALTGSPR